MPKFLPSAAAILPSSVKSASSDAFSMYLIRNNSLKLGCMWRKSAKTLKKKKNGQKKNQLNTKEKEKLDLRGLITFSNTGIMLVFNAVFSCIITCSSGVC